MWPAVVPRPNPNQAAGLHPPRGDLPQAGSTPSTGTSSGDLRPSQSTNAWTLLLEMRSITPRRSVQSNRPGRLLLLNAAATRAVSFTRSPRLIIFRLFPTMRSPPPQCCAVERYPWQESVVLFFSALVFPWGPKPGDLRSDSTADGRWNGALGELAVFRPYSQFAQDGEGRAV